jgi:hypothetical protein
MRSSTHRVPNAPSRTQATRATRITRINRSIQPKQVLEEDPPKGPAQEPMGDWVLDADLHEEGAESSGGISPSVIRQMNVASLPPSEERSRSFVATVGEDRITFAYGYIAQTEGLLSTNWCCPFCGYDTNEPWTWTCNACALPMPVRVTQADGGGTVYMPLHLANLLTNVRAALPSDIAGIVASYAAPRPESPAPNAESRHEVFKDYQGEIDLGQHTISLWADNGFRGRRPDVREVERFRRFRCGAMASFHSTTAGATWEFGGEEKTRQFHAEGEVLAKIAVRLMETSRPAHPSHVHWTVKARVLHEGAKKMDTRKAPGVWTTERIRLYVANHYLERKERAGDAIAGLPHEGTDMEIFERFSRERGYVGVGFLREFDDFVRSCGRTLAWRIFEPKERGEGATAHGKETTTVDQALPKGPAQGMPKVSEQEPAGRVEQALGKGREQELPKGPAKEMPKVPEQELAGRVEQELGKGREQELPKGPAQETPKVPEQELAGRVEQELGKGREQELSKGPAQETPKVPEQEPAGRVEQELGKGREQELSKGPAQETPKAPEQEPAGRVEQPLGKGREQELPKGPAQETPKVAEQELAGRVEQALGKGREQELPKGPAREMPKQTSPKEARMTTSSFDYDKVVSAAGGRVLRVDVLLHNAGTLASHFNILLSHGDRPTKTASAVLCDGDEGSSVVEKWVLRSEGNPDEEKIEWTVTGDGECLVRVLAAACHDTKFPYPPPPPMGARGEATMEARKAFAEAVLRNGHVPYRTTMWGRKATSTNILAGSPQGYDHDGSSSGAGDFQLTAGTNVYESTDDIAFTRVVFLGIFQQCIQHGLTSAWMHENKDAWAGFVQKVTFRLELTCGLCQRVYETLPSPSPPCTVVRQKDQEEGSDLRVGCEFVALHVSTKMFQCRLKPEDSQGCPECSNVYDVELTVSSSSVVTHFDDPTTDAPGDRITNSQMGPTVLFVSGPAVLRSDGATDFHTEIPPQLTLLNTGDIVSFGGLARYGHAHSVCRLDDAKELDYSKDLSKQDQARVCVTLRTGASTKEQVQLFQDSAVAFIPDDDDSQCENSVRTRRSLRMKGKEEEKGKKEVKGKEKGKENEKEKEKKKNKKGVKGKGRGKGRGKGKEKEGKKEVEEGDDTIKEVENEDTFESEEEEEEVVLEEEKVKKPRHKPKKGGEKKKQKVEVALPPRRTGPSGQGVTLAPPTKETGPSGFEEAKELCRRNGLVLKRGEVLLATVGGKTEAHLIVAVGHFNESTRATAIVVTSPDGASADGSVHILLAAWLDRSELGEGTPAKPDIDRATRLWAQCQLPYTRPKGKPQNLWAREYTLTRADPHTPRRNEIVPFRLTTPIALGNSNSSTSGGASTHGPTVRGTPEWNHTELTAIQLSFRALDEQKGREVATAQLELTKNHRKEMQGMQEKFHAQHVESLEREIELQRRATRDQLASIVDQQEKERRVRETTNGHGHEEEMARITAPEKEIRVRYGYHNHSRYLDSGGGRGRRHRSRSRSWSRDRGGDDRLRNQSQTRNHSRSRNRGRGGGGQQIQGMRNNLSPSHGHGEGDRRSRSRSRSQTRNRSRSRNRDRGGGGQQSQGTRNNYGHGEGDRRSRSRSRSQTRNRSRSRNRDLGGGGQQSQGTRNNYGHGEGDRRNRSHSRSQIRNRSRSRNRDHSGDGQQSHGMRNNLSHGHDQGERRSRSRSRSQTRNRNRSRYLDRGGGGQQDHGMRNNNRSDGHGQGDRRNRSRSRTRTRNRSHSRNGERGGGGEQSQGHSNLNDGHSQVGRRIRSRNRSRSRSRSRTSLGTRSVVQ